jgi:hypothetical protein
MRRATQSPSADSLKYLALFAPFLESHAVLKIGISAPQFGASHCTVRAQRYAMGFAPSGSPG